MMEWKNEPDEYEWVDQKTGYSCYIRRVPEMKHLCGYVKVYPSNFFYSTPKQFSGLIERHFRVHGGVTFIGEIENKDGLWFGFDCCHAEDIIPEQVEKKPLTFSHSATYKNIEFVKEQCELLAKQLKNFETTQMIKDMHEDLL